VNNVAIGSLSEEVTGAGLFSTGGTVEYDYSEMKFACHWWKYLLSWKQGLTSSGEVHL